MPPSDLGGKSNGLGKILGKRPDAKEEAVKFQGTQDGLLQDHWSTKGHVRVLGKLKIRSTIKRMN